MMKHLRTPLFCYWVHKTNSLAIQHWQSAKYVHLSFVFRRFSRSWHFHEFFGYVFVLIFFKFWPANNTKSEIVNSTFFRVFLNFSIFLKKSCFYILFTFVKSRLSDYNEKCSASKHWEIAYGDVCRLTEPFNFNSISTVWLLLTSLRLVSIKYYWWFLHR